MKALLLCILLVFVLLPGTVAPMDSSADEWNITLYHYRFELERVLDGDTIHGKIDQGFGNSKELRVRMAGYDAPETWRPKTDEEREAGKQVTEYLKELLEGQSLILHSEEMGIYARAIGILYIEGDPESVNDKVVRFMTENQLDKWRFR